MFLPLSQKMFQKEDGPHLTQSLNISPQVNLHGRKDNNFSTRAKEHILLSYNLKKKQKTLKLSLENSNLNQMLFPK